MNESTQRNQPKALLLVDGYKMIGSWTNLRRTRDNSGLEFARRELIETLINYSAYKNYKTQVVFDAKDQKKPSSVEHLSTNLSVCFTAWMQTADTYIEKVCASFFPRKDNIIPITRIIVATSDRDMYLTAMGYGAEWISLEVLAQDISQTMQKRKHQRAKDNNSRLLFNSSSIKSFKVGNFKAFSDIQHIPLRPLTLIYGANSSGKSSILHSLLLAHHAIKNKGELDIYRTEAGGDSVDLGGFGQYVYKRDRTSKIQFAVDIDPQQLNLPDKELKELLKNSQKITLLVGIGRQASGKGQVRPRLFSLEIDNKELFSMSSRPLGRLQLDILNLEHPIIKQLLQAIIDSETFSLKTTPQNLEDIVNKLVPQIDTKANCFFPRDLQIEGQKPLSVGKIEKISEDPVNAVRIFLPYRLNQLISAIVNAVESEILKLSYLGPFRTYPPRHFAFSHQQDDNWNSGGGYAWDILLKDDRVREKVNAWLGDTDKMKSPYEIIVRNLIPDLQLARELFPRLDQSLNDFMTRLMDHAASSGDYIEQLVSILMDDPESLAGNWVEEISESGDRISDLVLIDKRSNTPVTHRDVGIGVSQVIPILVSCYGLSDSLIAIEQPEIHLHPKLQAELASVFAESIKSPYNNRFILETHSEHIMLRLQKLIREGELTSEDISVIYVDCDHQGSTCLQLRLDEEGDFIDEWPNGFFEEDFNEIFS